MKPRQLPWKWLLLGLVVLLITVVAVLLPRQIGTSSALRDRIAAVLSAWTGGTVTLTEPISVRYFPLSLRGGLVLTNVSKLPAVETVIAPNVKISLDFAELLMGRIEIDALMLGRPKITLKADASEPGPSQMLEGLTTALTDVPVGLVRVGRGTIRTDSGEELAGDVNLVLDARDGGGAFTAVGSLKLHGEPVAFSIESGAVSVTEDEKSARVTLKVNGDPVTARFSGTARLAGGLKADGNLHVAMSDARRFLNWVGIALPEGQSLKDLNASGRVHWSDSTLTFDRGTYSLDGNEAVGLLAIIMGERPRVEGTLAFERLVLDTYIGGGDGVASTDALFDWALLKYLDADLRISTSAISASSMELGRGGFTIAARQGAISGEVGELELCGGRATGRAGLDLSRARAKAYLIGTLSDIGIESCLGPLALGVPLRGVGKLKIDVSTGGKTQEELIRGLTGEFRLTASNGALPINLRARSPGTDPGEVGWSKDAGTAFDTLSADCRLSAGHISCQSFNMETEQGAVSGSGGLDATKLTLDWDFLIVDRVAPLSASQLVMEATPRVTVRGPLAQPHIERAGMPLAGDGSPQSIPESTSASPR